MGVPQVVIVGRPNVGKSSIFNWLVEKRLAIVDDIPGVTRDRITYLMNVHERYFDLVDTGGIGIEDSDNLTKQIQEQIQTAMKSADVILFAVDTLTGPLPLDQEIANQLRSLKVPILYVANKTDHEKLDSQANEFYSLGPNLVIPISAKQNRNHQELLDLILDRLGPERDLANQEPEQAVLKVAIVGRRNTGKSTFINTISKAERMIVSEVPGTTRDSVDVRFELDGKAFIAIDTAGLRRRKSVKSDVDFYSMHRAQRSIRRADVVLLFFDATQRISKVDKQLCDYITQQFKPCFFVVNKWDLLINDTPSGEWVDYLRDKFPTMVYAPIAFITGQSGKNVKALLNHGQMLFKQSRERVSTGELNRLVRAALDYNPPPMYRQRRPKIYYATQVSVQPPTIVFFCNDPQAITKPYQRYLLGFFRDHLSFAEVPIRLYLRQRGKHDHRDEIDSKIDASEPVDISQNSPSKAS